MPFRVEKLADAMGVARSAAEIFVTAFLKARQEGRAFTVALAGGATPRALYTLLASPEYQRRVAWEEVSFFFSDERGVPPEHPDSNYRAANELLFRPLKIPASHIHRMRGESEDLGAAAALYEQELRDGFGGGFPEFDLVLLGMGPDGHTASLFPGSIALKEEKRWVVPVLDAPKPPPRRLTLTVPVLKRGKEIVFMVTGADKAAAISAVLKEAAPAEQFPAKLINAGSSLWLVDQAAASLL